MNTLLDHSLFVTCERPIQVIQSIQVLEPKKLSLTRTMN